MRWHLGAQPRSRDLENDRELEGQGEEKSVRNRVRAKRKETLHV